MQHYYAVCEPDGAGGFWISFPGRDGLGSATDSAVDIVLQAQDALGTLFMHPPAVLPPSIEDGAKQLDMIVPAEKIARARELAQVPETDPDMLNPHPLTWEAVQEILDLPDVWSGFAYFLAPDR